MLIEIPSLILWTFIFTVDLEAVAGQTCLDGRNLTHYTGQVSITDGGRICQRWSKKKPNAHAFKSDEDFPLDGSAEAAENYCRNIDYDPVPWCYTRDPNVRWQYCRESICGVKGPKCGGSVAKTKGWLTSIDRDGDGVYDPDRDCLWILKAPENKTVEIHFHFMDIARTKDCTKDYLEVYESAMSHGKFCGPSLPRPITSESNWLYVRFHSVPGPGRRGFNLTYVHTRNDFTAMTDGTTLTTNVEAPPTEPDISKRGGPQTFDPPALHAIVKNITAFLPLNTTWPYSTSTFVISSLSSSTFTTFTTQTEAQPVSVTDRESLQTSITHLSSGFSKISTAQMKFLILSALLYIYYLFINN